MIAGTDPTENVSDWFVYMIESSDGRLYTGVTTDVERRFIEHGDTKRGARFFRGRKPVKIVYTETHPDRSSALKREAAIKQLTRKRKLKLIRAISVKPPGRPC